jgi:CheY-like chemotaxis protein
MGALPPILIVDDDPDDLFIFKRLLSKAGIQNKIIAFEDPTAAIDYLELESHNPDRRFIPCVVLTDLHMPEMTGFDVVTWVRAHPKFKDLPVIIISSSESPEDEQHAAKVGATRFLRKYPSSDGVRSLIAGLPCQGL